MLFSIIVPIYNVEKHIEKCITSLLSQTFSDFEIILVDDGSTDNSASICKRFCLNKRIKYFYKENGGLSDARNFGIKMASGDFIIFVDSDDFIEETSCQVLSKYCQGDVDIVLGNAKRIEGDNVSLLRRIHLVQNKEYDGENALKYLAFSNNAPMAAWLNIYRRSFLLDNNLFFEFGRFHEDEQFTPRAFITAKKIIDSNFVFYNYIIRDDSITTKKDKTKNAEDMYLNAKDLVKFYERLHSKKLRKKLENSLVDKYLNIYIEGRLFKKNKKVPHRQFFYSLIHNPKTFIKLFLLCHFPGLCYKLFYLKNK